MLCYWKSLFSGGQVEDTVPRDVIIWMTTSRLPSTAAAGGGAASSSTANPNSQATSLAATTSKAPSTLQGSPGQEEAVDPSSLRQEQVSPWHAPNGAHKCSNALHRPRGARPCPKSAHERLPKFCLSKGARPMLKVGT